MGLGALKVTPGPQLLVTSLVLVCLEVCSLRHVLPGYVVSQGRYKQEPIQHSQTKAIIPAGLITPRLGPVC